MFNWIKNKLKGKKEEVEDRYSFRWYEIGEAENPFNKRVLDIRSFTWNMTSTTQSEEVAVRYVTLRSSLGENHRGASIKNEESTQVNLIYPHNGEKLEGAVFKSPEMECKWDIYIYDEIFYFVRSWSDDLILKAHAEILADKFIIKQIDFDNQQYNSSEATNAVHFLIKSHAFGQPFPHHISQFIEDEEKLALLSFSLYGNKACYATFDDITDTTISITK